MADFQIKGWCPSALRPMLSGDGWLVRLRPRMARLTARQATGLAKAARQYGNGLIDLTARGAIQLRGIGEANHPALIADLQALGLIDRLDQRIVVSPYWQPGDGTAEIVDALEMMFAAPGAPRLPDKFGFSIGLSRQSVLHRVAADIRIEWHHAGILVRADSFAVGRVVQTPAEAGQAACDLATWFLASGGAAADRGRMARLWPEDGFGDRQRRLPPAFQTGGALISEGDKTTPGLHPLGMLVGLEFGQMGAETLMALATQPLRITPWRLILLEGAAMAPAIPGLITDAADPRLRVTACSGAPACAQGLQPTRPLARALATLTPEGQHLHVSGCTKGCAHPGPADLTLTATADGYAIIRNGRASGLADGAYAPSSNPFKAL